MVNVCIRYFVFFLVVSIALFLLSTFLMIQDLVFFFEYEVLLLNSSPILMTILIDWMASLFMSFVLFISAMVIFYSKSYMDGDLHLDRFILLVVMFVLSMMLLIISPNLISILLGWDGLGLVSYCLVIYYQNVKSFNAGMITALTNRIGDVALLMSIAWMLNFGSWNYVFYLEEMKSSFYMIMITVLVILAALTKSAQIPFSSWLPAAMAAPTPVSSLVHSSTLVTAGVYLLIRFNYSMSEGMLCFLLFVSSMTMFMSGLGANFEFDLKKIIALSTLSQLGLMMMILSLGSYKLAFFHLLTHALFKALLFMCAGNVIHSLSSCQDIRFMGGLVQSLPLTCVFMNICNLSLCGIPFLSGFYSKDLVAEVLSMEYLNMFIYMIFFISLGLTVSYSFRLVYYLLVGDFNFVSLINLSEKSYVMLKGMGGLIFLVVIMGSVLSWMIFDSFYLIVLPITLKLMTLLMISSGMLIGYFMARFSLISNNLSLDHLSLSFYVSGMWHMPTLSTFGVNYYPIYLGNLYIKSLDQGWTEFFGSQNLYNQLILNSQLIQFILSNSIKLFYMLTIIFLIFVLI
uniref:NADH-ubiquinone oxidoreductase chain 5 n=1 Tax=Pseudabris przewalskyi TaxID=3047135 RepID=A0AA51RIH3_9CUCU|nr:NADH dehydrogenase subunit 5 [Pseudabris przewalskyi]WMQ52482.1 NADH dehydrogenase subunit 5 [Pseudabris przewalskyi]